MQECLQHNLWFYWYNVVKSLDWHRYDPAYAHNYRNLIFSAKHAGELHPGGGRYHSPRIPKIKLPQDQTEVYGIIHLQAINERFYALKQLWYKQFEYKVYKYGFEAINKRYDPIVHDLMFQEVRTPREIVKDIEFDPKVFDEVEKAKGYKEYVLENYQKRLVTFGEKYLNGGNVKKHVGEGHGSRIIPPTIGNKTRNRQR
jgi:hypothetical protein